MTIGLVLAATGLGLHLIAGLIVGLMWLYLRWQSKRTQRGTAGKD